MDEHIQFSIDVLKEFHTGQPYLLAFSGGKDSIVLERIARMSGLPYFCMYSNTGIDPPEILKFIKSYYPLTRISYPKYTFWHGVRAKCPPLIRKRWCCDILKERNGLEIKKKHIMHLTGVRAQESPKRAERGLLSITSISKRLWEVKPLFYWTEEQIWDFIEGEGLAYCRLYDEGFDRLGCCICPFICRRDQYKVNKHRKYWPGYYKVFEKCVQWWFDNKAAESAKRGCLTPSEYIWHWYRGFTEIPEARQYEDFNHLLCLDDEELIMCD